MTRFAPYADQLLKLDWPTEWTERRGGAITHLAVMAMIVDDAQKHTGLSALRLSDMAQAIGCDDRPLRRAMIDLVEAGWLTRVRLARAYDGRLRGWLYRVEVLDYPDAATAGGAIREGVFAGGHGMALAGDIPPEWDRPPGADRPVAQVRSRSDAEDAPRPVAEVRTRDTPVVTPVVTPVAVADQVGQPATRLASAEDEPPASLFNDEPLTARELNAKTITSKGLVWWVERMAVGIPPSRLGLSGDINDLDTAALWLTAIWQDTDLFPLACQYASVEMDNVATWSPAVARAIFKAAVADSPRTREVAKLMGTTATNAPMVSMGAAFATMGPDVVSARGFWVSVAVPAARAAEDDRQRRTRTGRSAADIERYG